MSPVVQIENLGKRYLIGHRRQERYQTLRDSMAQGCRNFGQRLLHPLRASSGQPMLADGEGEEFWALKDVSFEVKQGDRIGIIGRNGAGKSTLLKILSRITEPTEGRVRIRGRVASLLEVGTGFHPELTGRENIYLNGAILGMGKAEIRRKFDEIVAFSEVEKFLDTPVKRYSSGMYVRLAFAVAAHLEPEILVVDEVLAVGDVQFQKKCLGKMEEVGREGRTVIFVSHNMGAVQKLCDRGILLQQGLLVADSLADEVVSTYLGSSFGTGSALWEAAALPAAIENAYVEPIRLALIGPEGRIIDRAVSRKLPLAVEVDVEIKQLHGALQLGVAVYNGGGDQVFHSYTTDAAEEAWPKLVPGTNRLRADLPIGILNEGDYRVVFMAALHKTEWLFHPDQSGAAVTFSITGCMSESPYWLHGRMGVIAPFVPWQLVARKGKGR